MPTACKKKLAQVNRKETVSSTDKKKPTTIKGNEICFGGGKYAGKVGWLNDAKSPTKKKVYVNVQLAHDKEKQTFVNKKNVANHHNPPTTYVEALLQQQPKVEKLLKDLCIQLAKCQIAEGNHISGLNDIFQQELTKAIKAQRALGNDAEYKFIFFNADGKKQKSH
eukprot:4514057-Ditylum_brightwellii.AAC.1